MHAQQKLGDRAVVIGASIAGLLAARVLSERFGQVVVLERDELPDGPAPRKGTPQVGHAHALLSRGRHIMEGLFPGFAQSLCARGAELGDAGLMVQVLVGGRPLARAVAGDAGLVCSRLLIEDEVRRRVRALANVQTMTRVDVVEPIYDAALARVTGVRIRVRDLSSNLSSGVTDAVAATGKTTAVSEFGTLAADLVVDCTGRGSRAPHWLRDWGFDAPEEERVTIGVGYATAYFERKPNQRLDSLAVISQATPTMMCPAVMVAQEPEQGDTCKRWVVTFGGFGGDHPEPTLAGIKSRALHCASDAIASVVHESRLLGPVTRYGFPHSQRRRYENLRRFPERFLVLGDAIASFNPIYGQGMTVAACEALALHASLSHGLKRSYRNYFRAASKVIDNPWRIAVGADLSLPAVQGKRTKVQRAINAYMRALFRAAEHDAKVALAFRRVTQLLARPQTLMGLGILVRVVWGNLLRRTARARQLPQTLAEQRA